MNERTPATTQRILTPEEAADVAALENWLGKGVVSEIEVDGETRLVFTPEKRNSNGKP